MYTVDVLTNNVMKLSEQERAQLFQLLSNNAVLLSKVLPELPLLNHILTNGGNAEHPLISSFNSWKNQ
jgi:hypothetical protein